MPNWSVSISPAKSRHSEKNFECINWYYPDKGLIRFSFVTEIEHYYTSLSIPYVSVQHPSPQITPI